MSKEKLRPDVTHTTFNALFLTFSRFQSCLFFAKSKIASLVDQQLTLKVPSEEREMTESEKLRADVGVRPMRNAASLQPSQRSPF